MRVNRWIAVVVAMTLACGTSYGQGNFFKGLSKAVNTAKKVNNTMQDIKSTAKSVQETLSPEESNSRPRTDSKSKRQSKAQKQSNTKSVAEHPLTENTYCNPILISSDGTTLLDIEGVQYHLIKDNKTCMVDGPVPEMRTKLTSVTIYESVLYEGEVYAVTQIGARAFYGETLTSVSLPYGLQHLNEKAFFNSCIEEIVVPGSVISIGSSCFAASFIKRAIIEDGVQRINGVAFGGCECLEEVVLPNTVQKMSIDSFRGCTALKKINIPSGFTEIPSHFLAGCKSLKSIEIHEGVKVIGEAAFEDTGLTRLILPEGLEVIGEFAFHNAPIEELYIPSTLTTLGDFAFLNCMKLKKITMPRRYRDIRTLALPFSTNTGYVFNYSENPDDWTIFTWTD